MPEAETIENFTEAWARAEAAVSARAEEPTQEAATPEVEAEAAEQATESGEASTDAAETADPSETAPEEATTEPEKPRDGKGRFTVADRVRERQAKREWRAKFEAERAEWQQAVAKERDEIEKQRAELSKLNTDEVLRQKVAMLLDADDYDGLAKLAGRKDFNEIVERSVKAFSDPSYKKTKELEARQAELERREKEREDEDRRRREEFEQERARVHATERQRQELAAVSEELNKHPEPAIAELAKLDPEFTAAVYSRMRHEIGAQRLSQQEIVEVYEDSIAWVLDVAKRKHEVLSKAFGGRPTSEAETATAVTPTRAGSSKTPAKPHKHVSKTQTAEVSAATEDQSESEFLKKWTRRLEQSQLEERKRAS